MAVTRTHFTLDCISQNLICRGVLSPRRIASRGGARSGRGGEAPPGFKLANQGVDTRSLQHYLGHKNIQHTVRYSELSPERFRDFWKD
jgi:Phage integrase family